MIQQRTFARAKRSFIIAAALACFSAAGVLTPIDVRSQLNLHAPPDAGEAAPRIEPPPAAIAPAGDAFAPRAAIDDEPRSSPVRTLPMLPPPTPATNARARPRLPAFVRVSAIATGSRPTAVVDDGVSVRVVTIGDSLEDSAIASIENGSVILVNGRHLGITP